MPFLFGAFFRLTINRVLQTLSGGLTDDQHWTVDSPLRLAIPVNLPRSGIETRLVVSPSEIPPARLETVTALQKALHKAMVWNQRLLKGEAKTMREIAKDEGVTQRFIAHRIQLAYLAPDIESPRVSRRLLGLSQAALAV